MSLIMVLCHSVLVFSVRPGSSTKARAFGGCLENLEIPRAETRNEWPIKRRANVRLAFTTIARRETRFGESKQICPMQFVFRVHALFNGNYINEKTVGQDRVQNVLAGA